MYAELPGICIKNRSAAISLVIIAFVMTAGNIPNRFQQSTVLLGAYFMSIYIFHDRFAWRMFDRSDEFAVNLSPFEAFFFEARFAVFICIACLLPAKLIRISPLLKVLLPGEFPKKFWLCHTRVLKNRG